MQNKNYRLILILYTFSVFRTLYPCLHVFGGLNSWDLVPMFQKLKIKYEWGGGGIKSKWNVDEMFWKVLQIKVYFEIVYMHFIL